MTNDPNKFFGVEGAASNIRVSHKNTLEWALPLFWGAHTHFRPSYSPTRLPVMSQLASATCVVVKVNLKQQRRIHYQHRMLFKKFALTPASGKTVTEIKCYMMNFIRICNFWSLLWKKFEVHFARCSCGFGFGFSCGCGCGSE